MPDKNDLTSLLCALEASSCDIGKSISDAAKQADDGNWTEVAAELGRIQQASALIPRLTRLARDAAWTANRDG